MDTAEYLIVPLLSGFEWFDEGLQRSLLAAGWPSLTRPESMVMMHVQMGIVRPAEIARSLRLTRQAVHSTIASVIARGLFELAPDPTDRRIKIVVLTKMGRDMRHDANRIVEELAGLLERRIGKRHVAALRDAFARDWGEPGTVNVATRP